MSSASASIIAVAGTLLGAAVTAVLEYVTTGAARRRDRADARRQAQLTAVTALVCALADHRRAMWVREDLRLSGADWSAARAGSHATRSALTGPLTTVAIIAPALADAARRAASAAYALRDAADSPGLARLRERAICAADDLTGEAARLLGGADSEVARTARGRAAR